MQKRITAGRDNGKHKVLKMARVSRTQNINGGLNHKWDHTQSSRLPLKDDNVTEGETDEANLIHLVVEAALLCLHLFSP